MELGTADCRTWSVARKRPSGRPPGDRSFSVRAEPPPGGGWTPTLLFTANLAPAQKADAGQGIECATHRSTVEDTAGTSY